MKNTLTLLATYVFVLCTQAFALNEVELVRNHNTYPESLLAGSSLYIDGKLFFEGEDSLYGQELWILDSENSTPRLVKDITSGPKGSSLSNFTLFKDKLFFTARTPDHGRELWSSDGTEAGTNMVKDIQPGQEGSSPYLLTPFGFGNERLAFTADQGQGTEFCVSNGTETSTTCYDIQTGSNGSNPGNFAVLNRDLFFSASNGTAVTENGNEIWVMRFNGIQPELFLDIQAGPTSSHPNNFTLFTGPGNIPNLIFQARSTDGREPWITDGTAANTQQIKNIAPAASSSDSSNFFALPNGGALFTARTDGIGQELWKTDGTNIGTSLLKDVNPGASGSQIEEFTIVENTVFFLAKDPIHGKELWKTDGTILGTMLVKDLVPGEDSSNSQQLFPSSNRLIFVADSVEFGQELHISDGTSSGTKLLLDIRTGPAGTSPRELFISGNKIGFFGYGDDEPAIFFVDPLSPLLTAKIPTPTNKDKSSQPNLYAELPTGDIFGVFRTASTGSEPHAINPTTGAITLLKDISPGSDSSNTNHLGTVNGLILFGAENPLTGKELWATDGTPGGTLLLKDILPGKESSEPQELDLKEDYKGYFYFSAQSSENSSYELWRTDGTTSGTKRFGATVGLTDPQDLAVALGNQLFFKAETASTNGVREIWKSNGNEADIVQISDTTITKNTFYGEMHEHDGFLFFRASNQTVGQELYRTNGTVGNITLTGEIRPGNSNSSISHFYSLGSTLLFGGKGSVGPAYYSIVAPYTQNEIQLLVDPDPSGTSGGPGHFFKVFDKLLFSTVTENENFEPWTTDGTPGGTEIFKIIQPGASATEMSSWHQAGDYFYFAATGGDETGNELWRSDGSATGTSLFEDLVPGPTEANPKIFGTYRGAFYFTYNDINIGSELHRIVFDECPDDPNKLEFGQCGCGSPDIDSDGDGTLDCSDSCSADSLKTTAGFCGCGSPETDNDGDGIPNCADECNTDSLKATAGACGCGIADDDIDQSGVADCLTTEEVKVRSDLLATLLGEFKRKPKKGRKIRVKAIFQAYKELNRYSRTQLGVFTNSTEKKTKKRLKNLRRKIKKFRKKAKNKNRRKAIKALARLLSLT